MLQCNPEYVDTFVSIGSTFSLSGDIVAQLNKFVCLLYRDKTSTNANGCRFALFKWGKCSDNMLPPTCDSLLQHIRRANYQTAIWRQSLDTEMSIPSPHQHGWRVVNGELEIVLMMHPPALDSILQCIHCGCKTGCNTQHCACKKSLLQCTDACTCLGCTNKDDDEQSDDEQELEEVGFDTDEKFWNTML